MRKAREVGESAFLGRANFSWFRDGHWVPFPAGGIQSGLLPQRLGGPRRNVRLTQGHFSLDPAGSQRSLSALGSVGVKACVLCCGVGRTRKLRQMSPDSAAWEPLPFGEDELVR